jgi:hypothetical protein
MLLQPFDSTHIDMHKQPPYMQNYYIFTYFKDLTFLHPAAKGVGESQFQRLEKRLALCLLCGYRHKTFTENLKGF